jgi:hypothetical protein
LREFSFQLQSIPKKISIGRHFFVGYDKESFDFMAQWLERRIRSERPSLTQYSDALLVPLVPLPPPSEDEAAAIDEPETKGIPASFLPPTGRPRRKYHFEGGVYKNGRLIDELTLQRELGWTGVVSSLVKPLSSLPGRADVVLEHCWFGGQLFNNFGHFLLETLSRISYREVAESCWPIVFLKHPKRARLDPFMSAIFKHLGFDPERIHLCNAPTHVGTLNALPQDLALAHSVNASRRDFLRRVRPSHAAGRRGLLYLSRSRFRSRRRIRHEEAIEAYMAAKGARIVYPETIPFDTQLQEIAAAKLIVGCQGSALHNIMFAPSPTDLIMLCWEPPGSGYLFSDEWIDGDSFYVTTHREPADRYDWNIDADKTIPILDRIIDERMHAVH